MRIPTAQTTSIMYKKYTFIQNRIKFALILILTCIGTAYAQSAAVEELTEKAWKGLGGHQTWSESRYFMFSYTPLKQEFSVGPQTFLWDSQSGKCRLDTKIQGNNTLTVLFNTRREKARVFISGQPVNDKTTVLDYQQKSLRAFMQGSYWLFIPQRLEDAAQSSIAGLELTDGKKYEVLEISEDLPAIDVSSSKYYIDSQSGKIDRWIAMDDNGQTFFDFHLSTFKDVGAGLLLPTNFTDIRRNVFLNYTIATSLLEVETEKFTKP
ncbi:hypothetical protein SAMN05216436_112106 [bacterium A37T11]|nr:hypothetical protein SAMN05216436_112106 [bacterium A37T11]